MKKYEIQYWEKEVVWCKRTVEVRTDKDPSKMSDEELKYMIAEDPNSDVDWIDGDYDWENSEVTDYDFQNGFVCQEIKNHY